MNNLSMENFNNYNDVTGYKYFKSNNSKKFCSDTPKGIQCNSDNLSDNEKFYIKDLGNNMYALKGGRSKKWCSNHSDKIICNKNNINDNEVYRIKRGQDMGKDIFGLISNMDNKHCSYDGKSMKCNKEWMQNDEKFIFDYERSNTKKINSVIDNIKHKNNIISENIDLAYKKNKIIKENIDEDIHLVKSQLQISNDELFRKENSLFILKIIAFMVFLFIITKLLVKIYFINKNMENIIIGCILIIGVSLILRTLYSFSKRLSYNLSEKDYKFNEEIPDEENLQKENLDEESDN